MYNKVFWIVVTSVLILVGCNKKEKKYKSLLTTADSLYTNQKYDDAKLYYLQASQLNPKVTYPIDKITEIDSILVVLKVETQYQAAVKIADELFDYQLYDDAIIAYQSVTQLKPGDPYANKRIKDIEFLISQTEQTPSNLYHVIVGSFSIKNNAVLLQEKLLTEGCDSYLISRNQGSFHAVTCASHSDIHDAYNHLRKARNLYHEEAWVLKYAF